MTLHAEEIARQFWATANLPDGYPRDIESAVALVLPVAIIKVHSVTTQVAAQWLARNGMVVELGRNDTDLLGCLISSTGHGVMFVSGRDPIDEQRLTIAHEAAHFMRHYLLPRERAIHALGDAIRPVLDGVRVATPAERVEGVLSGVRIGPHVHLLPRGNGDERVADAENDADLLGLELLAPRSAISSLLRTRHLQNAGALEQALTLQAQFGVPAHAFACQLEGHNRPRPAPFATDAVSILRARE